MECKNCYSALSEENDFCQKCGAKVIRNRLTVKNLLEYFSETYFNYDNKFFRTSINLITKPEDVIGSFINGVRKKYIDPVSYIAISFSLSGIYLFFFKDNLREQMDMTMANTYQGQEKLNEAIFNFVFDYNSILYLVIIPVLALISWILFYKKKYNYTEHVVIYLYSMSLTSIFSIFITIALVFFAPKNYALLSSSTYILMLFYHMFILKRLFELSVKQLIIKTLLFIPLFIMFYLIGSIIMVVTVILLKDIPVQEMIKAK